MSKFPYTPNTIPKMDCDKEFCLLMYKSHKDSLTKFQNLEQQHAILQTRYKELYDHRVTHGTTSESNQAVLPNGETLSAETFMQRTRMFEQNRMAMDRLQKELAAVQKDLATAKTQMEKKSQQAREFEQKLNGFHRAQEYVYTNEQHRAAAKTNEEYAVRIIELERENEKLKCQKKELIHRTNFIPCETVGQSDPSTNAVPLTCPYGDCPHYNDNVTSSTNPAIMYQTHLTKHRVRLIIHFHTHSI
jgi:hypothetical protein